MAGPAITCTLIIVNIKIHELKATLNAVCVAFETTKLFIAWHRRAHLPLQCIVITVEIVSLLAPSPHDVEALLHCVPPSQG